MCITKKSAIPLDRLYRLTILYEKITRELRRKHKKAKPNQGYIDSRHWLRSANSLGLMFSLKESMYDFYVVASGSYTLSLAAFVQLLQRITDGKVW